MNDPLKLFLVVLDAIVFGIWVMLAVDGWVPAAGAAAVMLYLHLVHFPRTRWE